MNIVDIIIIILILSFGIVGFKTGFIKQTVFLICTIASFIIAYYLKDYVANFLSYTLPFFKFGGEIEGLTSLNILMYQVIGFCVVFSIVSIVANLLIKVAGLFENILKATIILSIPSKILGFFVGLIEGYVIIFIALFILSQPFVNLKVINNSKLTNKIVNSSPVLSKVVEKTNNAVKDVYHLVKDYTKDNDKDKFNRDSIDIMLDKKIIKVEYVEKLIDKDKLEVKGIDEVLDKYK